MKQAFAKKGTVIPVDVPEPSVTRGFVKIKVAYSTISAGTEMTSVKGSGKSMLSRLIEDPAKILRVEVASDRKMLRNIEADEVWKYSVYDDGAAATNYLNIWYIEYYDTVTDSPEALRPLIALEAVMFAISESESACNSNKVLLVKFPNRINASPSD